MLPEPRRWTSAPEGGHPSKWAPGMHVLPIGDTTEHDNHPSCWCGPTRIVTRLYGCTTLLVGGTWQHHAQDGREAPPHAN